MKKLSFRIFYVLLLVGVTSCGYSEGDWGATVGECDEICTVYHTAQLELMKNIKLYDRDFPDEELRRRHVVKIKNGHRIESWFITVDENNDTTRNAFTCEVYYDKAKIGYVVRDLEIKSIGR